MNLILKISGGKNMLDKKCCIYFSAACVAMVMFSSYCYATTETVEVSVTYNEAGKYIPKFQLPGKVNTQYTLTTKGMRKIETKVLITNWSRHLLDDTSAPSTGCDVVAVCTPTKSHKVKDMTDMVPGSNFTGTQLACEKGKGIAIIVLDPTTQDYEYVADLTITTDDEVAQSVTESVKIKAQDHIDIPAPTKILAPEKIMPHGETCNSCDLM